MGNWWKIFAAVVNGGALVLLLIVVVRPAGAQTDSAVPGFGLELVKTVSDDGSCGTADVITVTWKTSLTYCYTATNTGKVTWTTHTLTDTVLVSILDGFPYELAPQATMMVTATFDPPNVTGPLENCALWTAQDGTGDFAQATDCATVYLLAPTSVSLTGFDQGDRWWFWMPMIGFGFILLVGKGFYRLRK